MRFIVNLKMPFCSMNLAAMLILTLSSISISAPAYAFTCGDVRGLSTEEQDYWSKRLHLTAVERHLIWVACYRDYQSSTQELVRR
jgi:hypothetical protein